MNKITIRYQQPKDAQRFLEILNNPNFIHFNTKPKSVESIKEWMKNHEKWRKDKFRYDYTILFDETIVGSCGIKINQHWPHIGEISYAVDEKYWGKGIATEAVKLLEKEAFEKLDLKRMEIFMRLANKASEKVAIKNGYEKEGILKGHDHNGDDEYLYAKVK